MTLDEEQCWRAWETRDARFDGRFFLGVVTTGIYCRPICPVPGPKRRNVRFFPSAAAAEQAGLRPCRRCRPETSPGTPAWLGSSAVVSRALRLISDGALDEGRIEELAVRLGIGERQLRRLFTAHLGASPIAVARARRIHFARRLLDETELPITNIAFQAGFGSVRQFNDSIRATFGQSPTELRARRRRPPHRENGAGLNVRLPYRPPLDWETMSGFLKSRAIPGVEIVDENVYRRTIEVNGCAGTIELRHAPDASYLIMNVQLPAYDGLIRVVERARRIFDLGADLVQINTHLASSPLLAPLVRARPGLRVPRAWDPFELAVRAVLGQQVTVRGATTLAGRLVRELGRPLPAQTTAGNDSLTHLFPSAAILAASDLSAIGIPAARHKTIRVLAERVAAGDLVLDASAALDQTVAQLCSIPGIGEWTAHYIAMRALGEPDALPVGDLGLRRAVAKRDGGVSASHLARLAEQWRPWRAYAAMHLWCADS